MSETLGHVLNTFGGLSSLNGQTGGTQTFAEGTAGTDFGISSAGDVHTFNLPSSSAANRGLLLATDWSTFNSKQDTLTFSTGLTDTAGTITADLSTGVAGGQSVVGGVAASESLTLSSTSHGTKGSIILGSLSAYDEVNDLLGIGVLSASAKIDIVVANNADTKGLEVNQNDTTNNPVAVNILNTGTGNSLEINSTGFVVSAGGSVGIGQAPCAGSRLCVPLENDATAPTISFGDGDSGFYEDADDSIRLALGGASKWQIVGNTFQSNATRGANILNVTSTNIQPAYVFQADENTGMGSSAADNLSLTTAGAEAIRIDASQNVGIGMSTLTEKLQVNGRITEQGTYASIYLADGSTAQSIPTGVAYTKLVGFTADGLNSNCTSDVANDKITITKLGVYRVEGSFNAASATAGVLIRIAAFLNGAEQDSVHCYRKYTNANDYGSCSFTGFIDVTTVPWDLDVRARHDNGGSINWTPAYMTVNVSYLGET